MINVIIFYDNNDKYFVNLLAAFLEYHYNITIQCYSADLEINTEFSEETKFLIVVISNNYLKSKLCGKEKYFFKMKKIKAPVIQLLLDSINVKELKCNFKDYQPIDFTECMLTGLKNLFSILGEEFLVYKEKRIIKKRRDDKDQRKIADRRESTMVQRMRTGFWKSYSLATGFSEYAELILGVQQLITVKESLRYEASKYRYLDREGKTCDVEQVLEDSINNIGATMSNNYFTSAANLIDFIIDDIVKKYDVELIDQRDQSNRRIGSDRRKDDPSQLK